MAKSAKNAEEIKAEEVMVESEEKKEEIIEQVKEPSDKDVEEFISVQLKVINKMSDRAKAKRLANRILRNRKR